MSTITREFTKDQLIEHAKKHIAHDVWLKNKFGETHNTPATVELARIALASLEAETVAYVSQSNLDALKRGHNDVFVKRTDDVARPVALYTAPPAPVSVPDEAISRAVDEVMATYAGSADECRNLVRKHIEDACRAAMLKTGKS